jgi:DNA-binding MarR family transcriptional regulator
MRFVWSARDAAFYILFAYAKNEQGDLTPKQARVLAALIREEFK